MTPKYSRRMNFIIFGIHFNQFTSLLCLLVLQSLSSESIESLILIEIRMMIQPFIEITEIHCQIFPISFTIFIFTIKHLDYLVFMVLCI